MDVFSRRLAALLSLFAGGIAVAASTSPAEARTSVFVGVGGPVWYGPPPPVYYYPPPPTYYYAPPPTTIVVPAPPPAVQGPAPAATWYYCDDPKGYYPYVANCNTGWRAVQPTQPQQ